MVGFIFILHLLTDIVCLLRSTVTLACSLMNYRLRYWCICKWGKWGSKRVRCAAGRRRSGSESDSRPLESKPTRFPRALLYLWVNLLKIMIFFFKLLQCTVMNYERSNLMQFIEHQSMTGWVKPQSTGQMQSQPAFVNKALLNTAMLLIYLFRLWLHLCSIDTVE